MNSLMNGSARRSFKLMIVDDSNIMRRRIERSQQFDELELIGTAGNGLEAIELFKKADPDVVTMDLTMPQMDGIEATQTIRKDPTFRNLPIISLTAKAMKGDREKCIEAGASDYITKPVDPDKLLSLMYVWLNKS